MQKNKDESVCSTGTAPRTAARWLDKNSEQVVWVLDAPGWTAPPAYATELQTALIETPIGEKGENALLWVRIDIEDLRLSPVAASLIIQGMPLQQLFQHALIRSAKRELTKSLLLLRGDFKAYDAPPRLRNVVLACTNRSITPEIQGALLESILSS